MALSWPSAPLHAQAASELDRLRAALRTLTAQARTLEDQRAALKAQLNESNQEKERLWSETSYASRQGEGLLFSIKHQVLWDWCAGQGKDVTAAMLEALERQFDHYDVHGIPSDFMMRQIGRAPYAAWQAL